MNTRCQGLQPRIALHAGDVLFGGKQRESRALGSHDEFGGVFRAEVVMVRKYAALRKGGVGAHHHGPRRSISAALA